MRVILTVEQLKMLLSNPNVKTHYPIIVKMKNVSKADFKELSALLKKKG